MNQLKYFAFNTNRCTGLIAKFYCSKRFISILQYKKYVTNSEKNCLELRKVKKNYIENVLSKPDLELVTVEEVTRKKLEAVAIEDLEGVWLVASADMQGEILIDKNKYVMFRPFDRLGRGIGKLKFFSTDNGVTTFEINIEIYTYENTTAMPPYLPTFHQITGFIEEVDSQEYSYKTYALTGTVCCGEKTENFNAAKILPWEPSKSELWEPNPDISKSFSSLFGISPINFSSQIIRAQETRKENSLSENISAHLDLNKYAVGDLPGVFYIPNYVSEKESEVLLEYLKLTPDFLKQPLKKRVCQEWGCNMCPTCNKSFISDYNIPPWTKSICDMLLYDGIFTPSTFPNSVRVHEYQSGQGIGPHCDGPIYVPKVAVLSLASTSVMHFFPKTEPYVDSPMEHYNDTFKFTEGEIGKKKPQQSVVMEPRSLLIFSGDSYVWYPHGVSDEPVDYLDEEHAGKVVNRKFLSDPNIMKVDRKYRVSLTIRNLLPRCNHFPQPDEYNMREALAIYNQEIPSSTATALPIKAEFSAKVADDISTENSASIGTAEESFNFSTLQRDLKKITEKQIDLEFSLKELKDIVVCNISNSSSFNSQVSEVLENLSVVATNLQGSIDQLANPNNK